LVCDETFFLSDGSLHPPLTILLASLFLFLLLLDDERQRDENSLQFKNAFVYQIVVFNAR
jgi:hypothetical protein